MNKAAALAALLLAACNGHREAPSVEIRDAWARTTVAGQSSTAAYLTIANGGGDERLIGVSSAAGIASLHSTSMEGGVMRMRRLDVLEIPSGSIAELKPGSAHVMITGLQQTLEAGQDVPLELVFERSGVRRVTAAVRPHGTDGA